VEHHNLLQTYSSYLVLIILESIDFDEITNYLLKFLHSKIKKPPA